MSRTRGVIAFLGVATAVAALARHWFDVVEVRGHSMAPALLPGDRLLVIRRNRPVQPGDVVLALDPRDASRELVKRVASVDGGGVELRGDDPRHSSDSTAFGRLPAGAVRWRILARYWPPERIGAIGPAATSDALDAPV
jgi:nickel-type superoxide dismutase maturation protease